MRRATSTLRLGFVIVSSTLFVIWFHRSRYSDSIGHERVRKQDILHIFDSAAVLPDCHPSTASDDYSGTTNRPPESEPPIPSLKNCPPFSPDAGYSENIFFIETSDSWSGCLTPASACGVESAARTNPLVKIHVYIDTETRPVPPSDTIGQGESQVDRETGCSATDSLRQLANVRIYQRDLRLVLNETSRGRRLEKKIFKKKATIWTASHLKDALKLALLRSHGGIYLDTKIVNYRPIHCLQNSTLYLDQLDVITDDILAFDKSHPFPGFAIQYAAIKYDPTQADAVGSTRFREAFHVFCNTSNSAKLTFDRYRCHAGHKISVLPWQPLFSAERTQLLNYFDPALDREDDVIESFVKRSFLTRIDQPSNIFSALPTSTFSILARRFCPNTWDLINRSDVLANL